MVQTLWIGDNMSKLNGSDIVYLIIMVVILIGVFALLLTDNTIPQWLIGVVGSSMTGIIGIKVGNSNG